MKKIKDFIKQRKLIMFFIELIFNGIHNIKFKHKYVNSSKYWEERYSEGGTSGSGSYGILAKFKAEVINGIVEEFNVKNAIELGCGDGNNLSLYKVPFYIGLDVSIKAIELCKLKFNEDKNKFFFQIDDYNSDYQIDLALSLDVLFHLIEDEIFKDYLDKLFGFKSKIVVIYSSNFEKKQISHEKHRIFTREIEKKFKNYQLIREVPNKFPFDSSKPNETSNSDFYIYQLIS